ncbi:aldehyde dehydrogenase family protein [Streptomyces sp. MUM 136J]|uniref:aldehyde dehydrogenase family protein n=1 Tax=Streptomyces sp. MUM 136J TaxID=2791992 RepID=UPI0035ABE7A3
MRMATEEIFGPVVTVTAFSSENEAVEIANGSDYGLPAGVYSRDSATAFRAARRLEAGMVFAQQLLPQHPRRPLRRHQAQRLRARARPRNTAHLPEDDPLPHGPCRYPAVARRHRHLFP